MKVLVTGAAGFIGFHVAKALLARGDDVLGIDNLNDYYDVGLKRARLKALEPYARFRFEKLDIADRPAMRVLFEMERPQRVLHMAAQAGVRYSLEHPDAYVDANLVGFANVLEGCRHGEVGHLVYASSSSVYGANEKLPYSVDDPTDHPVSLYAASKRANELMAHSYAHLFKLPTTGLRFFTVYGPWGRPDMSLFLFTRKILAGEPIDIFNHGDHARDFTFIDDCAGAVVSAMETIATPDESFNALEPNPATSKAPFRIYNVGNTRPVPLLDFIAAIEKACGRPAEKRFRDAQPGDVHRTSANIAATEQALGFAPSTSIDVGVARFVAWYRDYYKV